jgi:pilus assembly protein Flp/PilA
MKYLYEILIGCVYGLHGKLFDTIRKEKGQTLVEYGLLLILIAVVVLAAVTLVGQTLNGTYSDISVKLP